MDGDEEVDNKTETTIVSRNEKPTSRQQPLTFRAQHVEHFVDMIYLLLNANRAVKQIQRRNWDIYMSHAQKREKYPAAHELVPRDRRYEIFLERSAAQPSSAPIGDNNRRQSDITDGGILFKPDISCRLGREKGIFG